MLSIFETTNKIHTLKNKPKGVSICDWMNISKPDGFDDIKSKYSSSWGQSKIDNKFYGWSHRAVASFSVGDVVKPSCCGNIHNDTEWTIKTNHEAAEQAASFADSVS